MARPAENSNRVYVFLNDLDLGYIKEKAFDEGTSVSNVLRRITKEYIRNDNSGDAARRKFNAAKNYITDIVISGEAAFMSYDSCQGLEVEKLGQETSCEVSKNLNGYVFKLKYSTQ